MVSGETTNLPPLAERYYREYYTHTYPYPYYLGNADAYPPPPPPPPPLSTPTRTLLLTLVPYDVSEATVRQDLGVFGDIRRIEMKRVREEGLLTVHYYDLRQATIALHRIQETYAQQQQQQLVVVIGRQLFYTPSPPPAPGLLAGGVVWAEFIPAKDNGEGGDGHRDGILVVFNLKSSVTMEMLQQIFEAFGSVKEVREPLLKRYPKFVEFYDTRDAEKALVNMNGKDINGKKVVVKFNRPESKPKHKRFRNAPPPPPPPPPTPPSHLITKKQDEQPRDKYNQKFLIKEDGDGSESSSPDSRTTLMIKNIPDKCSKEDLLTMLDAHCIQWPPSSYDFFHLPIDAKNKCNVGYGFVNMTSPEAAMKLYKEFHHKKWDVLNPEKICEVSYARLQGLDALKNHSKDPSFPCDYTQVVFDPPRDGQRPATPITERESRESNATVEKIIWFGSFPTVV